MSDDISNNSTELEDLKNSKSVIQETLSSTVLSDERRRILQSQLAEINRLIEALEGRIVEDTRQFRIPVYYMLGSILESISKSLGSSVVIETDQQQAGNERYKSKYLNIKYHKIQLQGGGNLVFNVTDGMTPDDIIAVRKGSGEKLNEQRTVRTVFELPIKQESILSLLSDREYVMEASIMDLIKTILELVKETLPQVNLVGVFTNDNRTLEIFNSGTTDNIDLVAANVYSVVEDSSRATEDTPSIILNYGASNSLVESIILQARLDPAYMSLFRSASTNNNIITDLFEIIRDNPEIRNELKNIVSTTEYRRKVNLGLIPRTISIPIGSNTSPTTFQTLVNDDEGNIVDILMDLDPNEANYVGYLPVVSRWLESAIGNNFDFIQRAFGSIDNGSGSGFETMAQRLLNSFLLSADATIHGTVGFGGFDNVLIKNYIPSVGGLYIITDVDDIITPGNFSTVLKMSLVDSNPALSSLAE